jgi:hypothetical protein
VVESISSKISNATFEHLDKNLPLSFYANEFSVQQYESLLKHLFGLFGEESTLSHTLAIKQGFKKFFEQSSQEISIHLDAKEIKLSKSRKKEGISILLDKALFHLGSQLGKLSENKKEFALRSYLYEFSPEELLALHGCFCDMTIDLGQARSHIREEALLQFPLKPRDIILFFSQKMYIRLFVPPQNKTGAEKRFNGYDPEKLALLYEERFPDTFTQKLLDRVNELEESALNFSQIDNRSFQQKFPDTIRSFLDIAMLPYVEDLDDETALALNGYILRLNFDKVLGEFADILLQKVLNRDKAADQFLRYYNGETIMDNNAKRIKKSSLVDSDQNIWNYSAIFSILTQYKQADKKLLAQENIIEEKESVYLKISNENKGMKVQYEKLISQAQQLQDTLETQRIDYNELKEKEEKNIGKTTKSRLLSSEARLNAKEKELSALKIAVDSFKIKLQNHTIETNNRKLHVDRARNAMEAIEKSYSELHRNYSLIRAALAKALIGR